MKDSYYIEFLEYMTSYIDEQRLEKILVEMQEAEGILDEKMWSWELIERYTHKYELNWGYT